MIFLKSFIFEKQNRNMQTQYEAVQIKKSLF